MVQKGQIISNCPKLSLPSRLREQELNWAENCLRSQEVKQKSLFVGETGNLKIEY